MALRIANNISAMNTQRWLSVADGGMKKSLERLSSGYRINKAADDAAGLAISQSFRANIASFKVASRNTSEASALLQVAEGGMDQIGNMLTRLKELATQASSANAGQSERDKIDAEGNALLLEIDRIAASSKYGTTSLLDGTFGPSKAGTLGVGTEDGMIGSTNNTYAMGGSTDVMSSATVVAVGSGVEEGTWYFGVNSGGDTLYLQNAATYSTATVKEQYTGAINAENSAVEFNNLGVTISITGTVTGVVGVSSGTATFTDSVVVKRTGLTSIAAESATTGTYTFATGDPLKLVLGNGTITQEIDYSSGSTHTFDKLGISFSLSGVTEGYDDDDLEAMTITVTSSGSTGSTFQIGAENNTDNRISISIGGATKSDLGLTDLDLSTAANAQAALDLVDTAISSLTSTRGDIGAYMNRLGYAAANLATTIENQQAAESVIRDVDMASEMTEFTKNQILLQAGTAMLAQANMAPQQVLSLFG